MPNPDQLLSIKNILDKSSEYLEGKGVESPLLNAELLLSHTLGKRRIDLYLEYDRVISTSETIQYKSLLKERGRRKPVQYILGETEFMGLTLRVDQTVLIPRPETEQMVEAALEILEDKHKIELNILDVGTGSGNIAIALASCLESASITALDASEEAIELAVANAERNGVGGKIKFLVHDFISTGFPDGAYDMIISNPPYVSLDSFKSLPPEVREWEPEAALTDYSDGLDFIKKIISLSSDSLKTGGTLLMEIGGDHQKEQVTELMKKAGYSEMNVGEDYNSHARFVSAMN
ncbi:MAG: peptide chain release factor N(5)-glutamine methyltransferase [Candidatus Marinimicrobia bacterium]|nr:peptide chain release factor N(5)-glutamine methyltransferase [Candidatus Neomarinimicrobiota bacterium]